MAVTGVTEMLNNVKVLEKGYDKKARSAVKKGAEIFENTLRNETPVSNEDHSGKGPLAQHVTSTNISIKSGEYESTVGYDKEKGHIAHFPNSGTSKQSPQHFIESTQSNVRDKVLQTFAEELKS